MASGVDQTEHTQEFVLIYCKAGRKGVGILYDRDTNLHAFVQGLAGCTVC
jgi:hypothetical protein